MRHEFRCSQNLRMIQLARDDHCRNLYFLEPVRRRGIKRLQKLHVCLQVGLVCHRLYGSSLPRAAAPGDRPARVSGTCHLPIFEFAVQTLAANHFAGAQRSFPTAPAAVPLAFQNHPELSRLEPAPVPYRGAPGQSRERLLRPWNSPPALLFGCSDASSKNKFPSGGLPVLAWGPTCHTRACRSGSPGNIARSIQTAHPTFGYQRNQHARTAQHLPGQRSHSKFLRRPRSW